MNWNITIYFNTNFRVSMGSVVYNLFTWLTTTLYRDVIHLPNTMDIPVASSTLVKTQSSLELLHLSKWLFFKRQVSVATQLHHLSMYEQWKKLVVLGFIGDFTTHLYGGDYINQTVIRIPIRQPVIWESIRGFFRGSYACIFRIGITFTPFWKDSKLPGDFSAVTFFWIVK